MAKPKPGAAPWEAVPSKDQLFVLITGANSGIGLATGQRLIDEFLATRSLTSHLILLPTTRSPTKCLETIAALRQHARHAAQTSKALSSRAGPSYDWRQAVARIHIGSMALDLCDLRQLRDVAEQLCTGTISNPPGLEGEYMIDVRIPRLDSVIFNAAYGGWTGVNYPKAIWVILTEGLTHSVTWPSFKNALPTRLLNEQPRYNYPAKPLLGEVFCACVFGHYVLAHHLLPLLSRRSTMERPGRIVWSSSIEAIQRVFNVSDMQCFLRPAPYESAKRLIDVLSLTCGEPATRPYSKPWLTIDDPQTAQELPVPPRVYLTHPGVVASTLFPVPWFLFWAYELALLISRWLGSPWHCLDSYTGSKSAAWITLQEQGELDELHAESVKWGSSCDRRRRAGVKMTEVEGWGWQGRVEDAAANEGGAVGILSKTVGRKRDCVDATEESIAQFEELGGKVWKEMEDLRHTWTDIVNDDGGLEDTQ